jgi:hypothetical protein
MVVHVVSVELSALGWFEQQQIRPIVTCDMLMLVNNLCNCVTLSGAEQKFHAEIDISSNSDLGCGCLRQESPVA